MTLRTRIAAAAGLAVALAVVALAVLVYLGVRDQLRDEVDDALRERAQLAMAERPAPPSPMPPIKRGPAGPPHTVRMAPPKGGAVGLGLLREPPQKPFGGPLGYAQLVLPDGDVVRRPGTKASLPVDRSALELAADGGGERFSDMEVDGTHVRVLTAALPEGGALQVARPLTEVDDQLGRIAVLLVVVGAGGVLLAIALGALVARTALAPVARFTRQTEQLTADPDLSRRIEAEGDDELARLARSFNTTLDALERSVEAQRALVADASHELRTPIASLRANIQTLEHAGRLPEDERAALRRDIVQELDELTALVGDVVELARGTKLEGETDDVRVHEIVGEVVGRARARANGGVRFDVDAEPTLVRGDPQRIQRAVSNLVDNAVKWSPPGASVEVSLRGGELVVRDHGPGFADADLPHVFERFYRSDGARGMPGSGLGLSIVRQAAEAHGGRVEAANAAGGGAEVRVSFGALEGSGA